MRTGPGKTHYYVLEGANSFATAYFFNYALQRVQRELGFGDMQTLLLCVLHGLIYIPGSVYGGRFAQRQGYFRALQVGFGLEFLGVGVAWWFGGGWAHVVGISIWTLAMCFVWPVLEALVSEHEPRDRLPNRVGVYNVVWAGTAALGVFLGGSIYKALGVGSLYWLPALIHAGQWLAVAPLKRRHDAWVASWKDEPGMAPPPVEPRHGPAYFQKLAWIGNPLNYMAVNTVLAIVPALTLRLKFDVDRMGWLMSIWFTVRALAFVLFWLWPGWHYRFRWFACAVVFLLIGFVAVVLAPSVWAVVLGQVALGWASALLYYSSLFYSMDGSDTKGEHGGIHEAFIGAGIFGGPAVSAVAVGLTKSETSPAWAVGAFIAAGLVAAIVIRARGIRGEAGAH